MVSQWDAKARSSKHGLNKFSLKRGVEANYCENFAMHEVFLKDSAHH